MSRFHGPQPGYKVGTTKGVVRAYKIRKRQEAEARSRRNSASTQQTSADSDNAAEGTEEKAA